MHTGRWTRTLLLTALICAAPATAAADWDVKLETDDEIQKYASIEIPSKGRDFINLVVYLRFVPKQGNRFFPAFIDDRNYLHCPDTEKRWNVNAIKRVDFHARSGVKILGFWFDKPDCEEPVFHMEAVVAELKDEPKKASGEEPKADPAG
jgi:hypothetical protein